MGLCVGAGDLGLGVGAGDLGDVWCLWLIVFTVGVMRCSVWFS